MNEHWKPNICKIVILSLIPFDLLLYLVIFLKRISFLYPKALNLTSEFVFTSWQVQSSLSTLTIALLAIILGRIDDSYYGLTVKHILFISTKKMQLYPNYWEKMLIVLILTLFAGLLIHINLFGSALVLELLSFVTLFTIIFESIELLTNSTKYSTIARAYTDELLRSAKKSNMALVTSHITNLGKDIESQMVKTSDAYKNETLNYLIDVARGTMVLEDNDELEQIRSWAFYTLERNLEAAVQAKAISYIRRLISLATLISDKSARQRYLEFPQNSA